MNPLGTLKTCPKCGQDTPVEGIIECNVVMWCEITEVRRPQIRRTPRTDYSSEQPDMEVGCCNTVTVRVPGSWWRMVSSSTKFVHPEDCPDCHGTRKVIRPGRKASMLRRCLCGYTWSEAPLDVKEGE